MKRRFRPGWKMTVFVGLLLPVVPFTLVVDGVVSNLRTYTVAELAEVESISEAKG